MNLYASGEDFLEAILVLYKKFGSVRSVDIARHMEVSKPSVCHQQIRKGGSQKNTRKLRMQGGRYETKKDGKGGRAPS